MRIGSFFTFLTVTLLASGFLLSDWLRLQREANVLRAENDTLKASLAQVNAIQAQTIAELESSRRDLHICRQDVDNARTENQALGNQVSELTHLNDGLDAENRMLKATLKSLILLMNMFSAGPGKLALFVALPVGSLVVGLLASRHHRNRRSRPWRSDSSGTCLGISVMLTKEERDLIISRRRRQHGME